MNDQKVFLAILLFSSMQETGVSAAPARTPPRPLWGYLSVAPPVETRMEVRSFAPGTLSLEQAVLDLDRKTTGRVVEIGFTRDRATSFYSATIGSGNGLHYIRIDPLTGRSSATGRPAVTRAQLDAEGLRILAVLGSARITLNKAISAAEALTGNKAVAAGIEQLNGLPQYYVQTLDAKQISTPVIVNPQTGRAARPLK